MRNKLFLIVLLVQLMSCSETKQKSAFDFYTSELFKDVQLNSIFPDSKTFVDCTPKRDIAEIVDDYEKVKGTADFDLKEFVAINFDLPVRPKSTFATDTTLAMEEHLTR